MTLSGHSVEYAVQQVDHSDQVGQSADPRVRKRRVWLTTRSRDLLRRPSCCQNSFSQFGPGLGGQVKPASARQLDLDAMSRFSVWPLQMEGKQINFSLPDNP